MFVLREFHRLLKTRNSQHKITTTEIISIRIVIRFVLRLLGLYNATNNAKTYEIDMFSFRNVILKKLKNSLKK